MSFLRLFLTFSMIACFLCANAEYNNESFIRIEQEQIYLTDDAIYVLLDEEVPVRVGTIHCDDEGFFIDKECVMRNCTRHLQVCSECGGCSAINCMRRCPNPNRCK